MHRFMVQAFQDPRLCSSIIKKKKYEVKKRRARKEETEGRKRDCGSQRPREQGVRSNATVLFLKGGGGWRAAVE
jgi:hypothetical protein